MNQGKAFFYPKSTNIQVEVQVREKAVSNTVWEGGSLCKKRAGVSNAVWEGGSLCIKRVGGDCTDDVRRLLHLGRE